MQPTSLFFFLCCVPSLTTATRCSLTHSHSSESRWVSCRLGPLMPCASLNITKHWSDFLPLAHFFFSCVHFSNINLRPYFSNLLLAFPSILVWVVFFLVIVFSLLLFGKSTHFELSSSYALTMSVFGCNSRYSDTESRTIHNHAIIKTPSASQNNESEWVFHSLSVGDRETETERRPENQWANFNLYLFMHMFSPAE